MKPAEDVRVFAEICARLNDPFAERASVLREAGLSMSEWVPIRDAWRERLAAGDDASAELGRVFGEAYAAEWARGPQARAKRDAEKAAPGADKAPAPAGSGGAPAATGHVVAASADRRNIEEAVTLDTKPSRHPGTDPTQPMQAFADPGVTEPTQPMRAVVDPSATENTQPMRAVVEPSPGASDPRPHSKMVTGGMPVPVVKEVFPFNPNAPSTLPEPSGKPPERKGVPRDTADVDIQAIARRVLAFGPEHARAEPSAAPKAAPAQLAPPPAAASAPSMPDLTLEQYASLCAEIAVFPQHADAIFQRYGLASQKDRPSVDRAWRERLRRDPSLYRDWQDLYQRYQEYWTQKARRGPAR